MEDQALRVKNLMSATFWMSHFMLKTLWAKEELRSRRLRLSQLKSILRVTLFCLRIVSEHAVFYSKIPNNQERSHEVQSSLKNSCRVLYLTLSELLFRLELDDEEVTSVFSAIRISLGKVESDGVVKLAGARVLCHLAKNLWVVNTFSSPALLPQMLDFALEKITEYTSSEDRKYFVKTINYLFQYFSRFEVQLCSYVQSKLDQEGVLQSS